MPKGPFWPTFGTQLPLFCENLTHPYPYFSHTIRQFLSESLRDISITAECVHGRTFFITRLDKSEPAISPKVQRECSHKLVSKPNFLLQGGMGTQNPKRMLSAINRCNVGKANLKMLAKCLLNKERRRKRIEIDHLETSKKTGGTLHLWHEGI